MKKNILILLAALFSTWTVNATTCGNETVVALGANTLVCGTSDDINGTDCAGFSSYDNGEESLMSFTPASTGSYTLAYSGQTYTGIFVFDGCPTSGGLCVGSYSTSTSSTNSTTVSLTGGSTYFILIDTWPSPVSPCPGTLTISVYVPPVGDNCSNAQDLAGLTSPYTSSTAGYTNDITVSCLSSGNGEDRIFYIDVPDLYTLYIGQNANSYDSKHRIAYGGACPGTTEVNTGYTNNFPTTSMTGTEDGCLDDNDLEHYWFNNTSGSTQRIYWVQDTYSGSGNFTLEWQLNAPPACPQPTALTATGITQTGATLGWTLGDVETEWDVEYGATPFTPTGFPTAGYDDITTTTPSLTGLSGGTEYAYYVRADCAAGTGSGQSNWSGPYTFTTSLDYCGADNFVDEGGTSGNYFTSNADETITICPDNPGTDVVSVNFLSFQLEGAGANACYDNLFIYDGPTTGATAITPSTLGLGTGTAGFCYESATDGTADLVGETITSTDAGGCLTFRFTTDGSGTRTGWEAVVTCAPPPSCLQPTALTATGVNATEATLGWTLGDSETEWDVEYGATPFTPTGFPTAGYDDITTSTPGLSGLTSNTEYEYYVRADCAAGTGTGQSAWSGPYTFTTTCLAVSSFLENFDAVTTPAFPACFSKSGASGSVSTQTGSNNTAPNCLYIYSSSTSNLATFVLRPVDNIDAGTHRLRFNARGNFSSNGVLAVGYMTDPSNPATFTSFQNVTITSTSYEEYIVNMGTTPPSGAHIAFQHTGSPSNSILVDDINWEVLPACIDPTGLTSSALAATGLTLDWTSGGSGESDWDIEFGATPFTPTGAPTGGYDDVSSTSTPITGLSANTEYAFYVRADCGAGGGTGESNWVGPYTVTTPCGVETPDYLENFSSFLNPCWSEGEGPATGPSGTTSDWAEDGFGNVGGSGSARMNFYGTGDQAWLISPVFDLTGGGFEINFDIAATPWTGTSTQIIDTDDAVYLMQSLDGGTTWTTIGTWDNANSPSGSGDNETIDISALTSSTAVFAFFADEGATNGTDMNVYIDNFQIRTPPTCFEPSGVSASSVTGNSLTLDWTSGGSGEADWDIEFGATPFTPTGTPTGGYDDVASTSESITGLSGQTEYAFYVRADCDADNVGTSIWVGPYTITTPCASETPDYLEDFATYLDPCWSEGEGTTAPSGTTSAWAADGFGNVGSTGAARFEFYGTTDDDWLISPIFDLTGGGFEINVDAAMTPWSGTSAAIMDNDDAVDLMQSLDGGTTWTSIFTWNTGNSPASTGTNYTIDISGLTSTTAVFAFYASEGGTFGPDVNFYIDNFQIRTPPSCLVPTALTATGITQTEATLGWTTGGSGETEWDVEYGATPFTPTGAPSASYDDITTTTPTLTGLTGNTEYVFYVRADCDAAGGTDESTWAGPFTFTTSKDYCGSDNFVDEGGTSGDYFTTGADETITICPDNPGTDVVSVNFLSFELEGAGSNSCYDNLYIYDGPTTGSTAITPSSLGLGSGTAGFCYESPTDGTANLVGETITSTDAGGCLTFRFTTDSGGSRDGWEAVVTCAPPPSCATPSGLSVSSITGTSADISWTDNAGASDWDLEFGATPFVPTGTPTAGFNDVAATTASLTGLTASTEYAVYVRADCDGTGGSDESAWIGPLTFNTSLANDNCADAILMTCGTTLSNQTNVGATDNGDVTGCFLGIGVWYTFVGNGDDVVVSSFADFDHELAVASSSDCVNFTNIGCDDGAVSNGTESVSFSSVSGTTYYFYVGGYGSTQSGIFDISVACTTPVPPGSFVWDGSTSNDWTDNSNWATGTAPTTCAHNVFIDDVANMPIVTGAVTCGNFATASGADMEVQLTGAVNVCGDVTLGSGFVGLGTGGIHLLGTGGGTTISVGASASLNNLFVEDDYALTTGTLNITNSLVLDGGDFTNSANVVLVSDAAGSAFLDDFTNPGNSYVGDLTVQRYVATGPATTGGLGQHYFGSAVDGGIVSGLDGTYTGYPLGQIIPLGCDPNQLDASSPYSNLFEWREAGPYPTTCVQEGWWAISAAAPLANSRGYSGWMDQGETLEVTGTPNTGGGAGLAYSAAAASAPVALTDARGWHLLANPYPSPLDISAVTDDNFSSPQYYDGSSANGYSGTFQPGFITGNIPIMQGFVAQTMTAETFQPDNSDRVAVNSNAFYKANNWFDYKLEVEVEVNGNKDITYLYYNDVNTAQFDIVGDCVKRHSDISKPTLYTKLGTEEMSLNGYHLNDFGPSIPMGLIAPEVATYTFTFDGMATFPTNTTIYVEDVLLGTYHNVADGAYTFTADPANNGSDRFMIHYVLPASFNLVEPTCEEVNGTIIENTNDGRAIEINSAGTVVGNGTLDGSSNVLAHGDYTIEVFDQYGGSQLYDFVIDEITPVDATVVASATTIEEGESIDFDYDGNGASSFEWTIDGQAVAQTEMFNYVFDTPGQYTVEVYASNQSCDAIATVIVEVAAKTTAIIEVGDRGTLNIYESNGNIVLEFDNINEGSVNASVHNLLGQTIASVELDSNGKQMIQNSNWANGYYIVKVQIGADIVNQTVLLTK